MQGAGERGQRRRAALQVPLNLCISAIAVAHRVRVVLSISIVGCRRRSLLGGLSIGVFKEKSPERKCCKLGASHRFKEANALVVD